MVAKRLLLIAFSTIGLPTIRIAAPYRAGAQTTTKIADQSGVDRSTVNRSVKRAGRP